jgi:DNA polymerase III subunit delta'
MKASDDAEEADRLAGAPHPRETRKLIGQDAAVARFLAASRAGRAPHAWLLTGPRGVGKATLAWNIARFLLAGGESNPGGGLGVDPDHPVWRLTCALSHPGLFVVRRPWDEKAGRLRAEIPVDSIRALSGFFRLSAAEAGARVAIIDSADEMNVASSNALLKLLEEPPAGGTLLLVSHRPARLLPTIRSRCAELRLAPLGPAALAQALAATGAPAPGDAVALAELAGGSVGAAFELVAADGIEAYDEILALLGSGPPLDRSRLIALASSAGRGAAARADLLLNLAGLALARIARHAAGARVEPVSRREAGVLARLGTGLPAAGLWAEAVARQAARAGHARAVHLDPGQVILDTLLDIDAVAKEAAALAA